VAGFVPFGKFVTLSGKALPTELHLQFSIGPVAYGIAGILLACMDV
jgi:hypothetical protein